MFKRLRRLLNLGLTDEKAWNTSLWNLRGSQSLSGEVVTEETALTYSAFWNAVNLISGTTASLPLHLMQRTGGKTLPASDSPLYTLLHDRVNPFITAMTFREVFMAHVLTWGNGFAEKVLNGYGEVIELWPIAPDRVGNIRFSPEEKTILYDIRVDGEIKTLPRARILHVGGLGYDGFIGYSVVAMARKSLGLAMAMETFGSRYFGNGTHPGVIVSHPNSLNDVSYANLKKSLTETYSGLGNSHRLMLLEDGMKIENVGVPPEDSQFLESRQFQVPEVARWFNLPPHKLKDLSKSSFNNIESEQISFVTDSILPWLIRLEQAFNSQLLTKRQRDRENLYFNHVIEGLLRANSKDRAEYYRVMIGNGVMTPNEARGKENMNPHEDPLADELYMPTGLIPMSMFEAYVNKNNGGTGNAASEENVGNPNQPAGYPEQKE